MFKETLDEFDVVVVDQNQLKNDVYLGLVGRGIILNFQPTGSQINDLKAAHQPLQVNTLFTKEERENASLEHLLTKQVLHYIEVYGLGAPGLFDLVEDGGEKVTMRFIQGVTRDRLGEMVRELIYSNKPVKDSNRVNKIVDHYQVKYDVNKIENNELRVLLYRSGDIFNDGDDAVRYLVYQATQSAMLIKSRDVIEKVRAYAANTDLTWFLAAHLRSLSQVFNRHKKIIMATKNERTKSVVNKISRYSKSAHVPLKESASKTFIADALSGRLTGEEVVAVLEKACSVRDLFKFLNILEHKKEQLTIDTFAIRNGKVWAQPNRPVYDKRRIELAIQFVLAELATRLSHLRNARILLDNKVVDFGLPISRKQALGQKPYGTTVKVSKDKSISAGIHWRNEWGASDLDLSAIDIDGNRTGWGQYSGYSSSGVVFSGDVTDARNGAMEFMTSKNQDYGLMVNIFSGSIGCKAEIVVGTDGENKWLDEVLFREEIQLDSKGNNIGFVRGNKFVIYQGRLNNKAANFGEVNPVLYRGLKSEFWTVTKLFDAIWIEYDTEPSEDGVYKYKVDANTTFAELEEILCK